MNDITYFKIESDNLEKNINILNAKKIKALYITDFENKYNLNNLVFLQKCPQIEHLFIHFVGNDIDISAIILLHNLKSLTSTNNPKSLIDLSLFEKIEYLCIDYHKNWENIFECKSLRELRLYKYPKNNLDEVVHLENLELLYLNKSKISNLLGLNSLTKLKFFEGVYLSKLKELNPDGFNYSIENIQLEKCTKIECFEGLTNFKNLETLYLLYCSPKINDVNFLNYLPKLKTVSLKGMTILDGNTSVFKKFDNIYFDNKKFYSNQYKDLALSKLKK